MGTVDLHGLSSLQFPSSIPAGLLLVLKCSFWNGNSFLDSIRRDRGCPDLYKDRTSDQTLKVATGLHCAAFENSYMGSALFLSFLCRLLAQLLGG